MSPGTGDLGDPFEHNSLNALAVLWLLIEQDVEDDFVCELQRRGSDRLRIATTRLVAWVWQERSTSNNGAFS